MTDRELINMAYAAAKNAYAPYSGLKVGAAVECADGSVFTGVNVENTALGSSVCAETAAVTAAVTAGKRRFVRIAIWADRTYYYVPCGNCRQILQEFAPNIEVLCVKGDGRYMSFPLKGLLPEPMSREVLE